MKLLITSNGISGFCLSYAMEMLDLMHAEKTKVIYALVFRNDVLWAVL
jgi:hypothetical protein